MSSLHKIALLACAALLGSASAVANPAGASPRALVSKHDLATWKREGTGNGRLAAYRPAEPAGYYHLGVKPSAAQIAGWSIAIPPDGAELPPGAGNVAQGGDVFSSDCAMCHGTFGEGHAAYPKLAGGAGSLDSVAPVKTVGSYWPYATTLYDYIDRAMPFFAPHALPPDQVYALSASILNLNGIVPSDFVADAKTLPAIDMPNRHGFIWQDPRPLTHNTECMQGCADSASLRITSDAVASGLTPRTSGPLDTMSVDAMSGDTMSADTQPVGGAHAVAAHPTASAIAAGRTIAFAREQGGCLACHAIAGGEMPGNAGPALKNMKTLVPDRKTLYAILYDEQKRNPQTIMPAFGKNGILTPGQINDVIDFLYTK